MTTSNQATTSSLNLNKALFNLNTHELYEIAICNQEAKLSDHGALVAYTGEHTGRSANDKFIVKDSLTENLVHWGKVNKPISPEAYNRIKAKFLKYVESKDQIYVQDLIAGADFKNSIKMRVITELAWHGVFIRNMLEPVDKIQEPEYTIISMPNFKGNPQEESELNSETFILVNFSSKEILIAGTAYAGEIKKSAFSILNFLYPQRNIMPMHSSANTDDEGNVSIFFGLSGTGKTTLSADPERYLIGDDEHGWSDEGIFNFENGCYAKSYKLAKETEPEIYEASMRYGVVIENVTMNEKRQLDYFDKSITENGRISYPLTYIPNACSGRCVKKQPRNIIMLSSDAFGVLPAVAKLSPEEAAEQFKLGYTAKLAGTEIGVVEPKAAFSACFGEPFMSLHPNVYADLLMKKIHAHEVNCWLVNTGWAGGAYGVGERMSLKLTRSIIHKINNGELAQEKTIKHPILGFEVPESVEMPEKSWKDQAAYKQAAEKLLGLFAEQKKAIGV